MSLKDVVLAGISMCLSFSFLTPGGYLMHIILYFTFFVIFTHHPQPLAHKYHLWSYRVLNTKNHANMQHHGYTFKSLPSLLFLLNIGYTS